MGNRRRRGYHGGYLQGPSHEYGGMPATINGGRDGVVELEGDEYVISAPVVKKLGVQFFDKLNRTANPYLNGGGFSPGELEVNGTPVYRRGGPIRSESPMRRLSNMRSVGVGTGNGNVVTSDSCDCMYNPNASPQYQCSGGCSNAGNSCGPSGGSCFGGGGTGGGGGGGGGGSKPIINEEMAMPEHEEKEDRQKRMGGRIRRHRRGGLMGRRGTGRLRPRPVQAHPSIQCPPMQCPRQNTDGTWGCGWCHMANPNDRDFRHGGRISSGSPDSCIDRMGNNVPCH